MKYLVIITALLLCFSVSAKTNSSYMIDGVKIEIQKENDCYYLLATGKEKETLICVDDELQSDIIIKDFNFDGYKDIAISSSLGMVNTVFYVFLYDHINVAFKKLKFADYKMPPLPVGISITLQFEQTLFLWLVLAAPALYGITTPTNIILMVISGYIKQQSIKSKTPRLRPSLFTSTHLIIRGINWTPWRLTLMARKFSGQSHPRKFFSTHRLKKHQRPRPI